MLTGTDGFQVDALFVGVFFLSQVQVAGLIALQLLGAQASTPTQPPQAHTCNSAHTSQAAEHPTAQQLNPAQAAAAPGEHNPSALP